MFKIANAAEGSYHKLSAEPGRGPYHAEGAYPSPSLRQSEPQPRRNPWKPRRDALAATASKSALLRRFAISAGACVVVAAVFVVANALDRAPRITRLAKEIVHPIEDVFGRNNLTVEGLTARITYDSGRPSLLVEGEVVNPGRRETRASPLTLGVRTPDKVERYVWEARPKKARLEPGERSRFSARLEAPPDGVVEVTVRFRDRMSNGSGDPEGS